MANAITSGFGNYYSGGQNVECGEDTRPILLHSGSEEVYESVVESWLLLKIRFAGRLQSHCRILHVS